MPQATDTMLLKMIVDNQKALKNIDKVQKKSDKYEKTSKGGLRAIKAGWIAAAAGIAVAIGAFRKIFTVTERQQRAENQLNAVLKSTGNVAGLTAKEVIRMAESLQKVTTFGDEAIIEGQNLLLTFKKIGEDVFPRATETMLDVAQAMGQDMKTTAVQLGKALNDPIQGLTALRRVGITFEKQQEETIKSMVKMGDIAGAQVLILDELESQFGGSARAAAKGVGVWKQVGNAFGDLLERGGKLIEGFDFIAKGLIALFSPAQDIEDVTQDLIKSQTEYTEVIKKLEEEQDTLSKTEKQLLEIRKSQLELDIAAQIAEVNKQYEEQNIIIGKATDKQVRVNDAYNELLEILPSAKGEFVELTSAQAALLDSVTPFNTKINEQGLFVVETSRALKDFTEAQVKAKSSTSILTEEQVKLDSAIEAIAMHILNENIPAETALLGLNEQLAESVRVRLEQLPAEIELRQQLAEQKAVEEEEEIARDEAQKARDAATKVRLDKAVVDSKKRTELKKSLIRELLTYNIDSQKELSKLEIKELKKRLDEYKKFEAARLLIAQTFVDGFLAGITSFKSSSKEVFASIVRQFTTMIAAQLAILAAKNLASVVTIPIGLAQLAAAATVKALGGSAASAILAAEHGLDRAPGGPVLVGEAGPEIVNLPRGSEVIPNNKINMSRFNTIPAFANGTNGAGDTSIDSSSTFTIQNVEVRANNVEEFRQSMVEFGEEIGVDFINP